MPPKINCHNTDTWTFILAETLPDGSHYRTTNLIETINRVVKKASTNPKDLIEGLRSSFSAKCYAIELIDQIKESTTGNRVYISPRILKQEQNADLLQQAKVNISIITIQYLVRLLGLCVNTPMHNCRPCYNQTEKGCVKCVVS